MHTILHDLRFALRMLTKSPGYTLVVIMTLALAIGVNTAIFSAVYTVLIRPPPFPESERLAVVLESMPEFPDVPVSYLNYVDYRDGNTTFSELGVYGRMNINLTEKGEPEQLLVDLYSEETMTALGVEPALGRRFLPEEDAPNGPRSVILTHGLWSRRYGADPAILGRTITLDGAPWTVVGVMPQSYQFLFEGTDLMIPAGTRADAPYFRERNARTGLVVVGRLKPGVTIEQAAADIAGVGASISERFPENFATCRPLLSPLREIAVQPIRSGLLLLMGAVACVLLIAIANVANLMLERAMTRQREMGIRAALGASRWRLIRPLLVESMLLALASGGLGLLLALWGVDLLTAIRPANSGYALFGPTLVDGSVLAFTLAVALATGLLFGLVPAVYASRQNLAQALKDADLHSTSGGRHIRARNLLVVVEVALALALLVAAALAIRGLARMQAVDPGFSIDRLLHARVTLTPERFTRIAEARAFWYDLRRRVAEVPGVESATIASGAPLFAGGRGTFNAVGKPVGQAEAHFAFTYIVDEHFTSTLKIPLLAGRTIGRQDSPGTAPIVVVDRSIADAMFPGQDPIGQRLVDGLSKLPNIEVVGVLGHVLTDHPDAPSSEPYQMYYALDQVPEAGEPALEHMSVLVRTRGEPHAIVPQLRAAVAALDPNLPLHSVATFPEVYGEMLAPRRYVITLLGLFAGVALALAAVGLYAVMASTVVQRTHELGVRMALGAQPRAIVALVVRQGMTLVAVGVALGAPCAYALTRAMSSGLPDQISPTDPLPYVIVAAVLAIVSVAATYVPARRATHIDPMVALRPESPRR